MIVAPSFLTADFKRLSDEISSISVAKWLHFDVMDGVFVPNKTYDHEMVELLRKNSTQFFDCHLMVDSPLSDFYRYKKAGADLITFHYEATLDATDVAIQTIRDLSIKVGISIKPATPVDVLIPYLKSIDLVLVMSVEPGKGGQKFLESSLDKIAFLSDYRKKELASFLIEVDGGINYETAKLVKSVGADVVVAGSYIFNRTDRSDAIKELENV